MYFFVAYHAEPDEILVGVVAIPATSRDMGDLEIGNATLGAALSPV